MKNKFVWSDNWCIEDETSWFVDGEHNILLKLDLKTNECNFVVEVPCNGKNGFRLNPRCIKVENDIVCMPDMGDSIWVYQLESAEFKRIAINNPNDKRLSIGNFWIYNKKIVAVSMGLNQIIEIDIQTKKIDNYYNLNEQISTSIKIDDSIYCVSPISNCIYQFNLVTKKCLNHVLPSKIPGIYTISYDGENFWLSGYCKEIYIWNREKNILKILDNFPEQFGIYNYKGNKSNIVDCALKHYDVPIFLSSIPIGQFIWFIPFQTNKIIYIDRDTYNINSFEIVEEDENEYSIASNRLKHKYLVEYILEDRYIGLFSLKNNCIFEIDTAEKRVNRKKYYFSEDCILKMTQLMMNQKQYFVEGIAVEREAYMKALESNYIENIMTMKTNIGRTIHQEMVLR